MVYFHRQQDYQVCGFLGRMDYMAGQERGFSSYAELKKTHRQELYDFPVIKYSRNMTEEDEAKEYARCGVSGRWEIIRADDGNCLSLIHI